MKKRLTLVLLLGAVLAGCSKEAVPPVTTEPPGSITQATTVPVKTTAPTIPETEPATTEATTTTVTTAPIPTLPVPTVPTTQSTEEATICGHDYQPGDKMIATCEQAGVQNTVCRKCGDRQQQILPPLGHYFESATCTAAARCSRCGAAQGSPLGHQYQTGRCILCGVQDPEIRVIPSRSWMSRTLPWTGSVSHCISEMISRNLPVLRSAAEERSPLPLKTIQVITGCSYPPFRRDTRPRGKVIHTALTMVPLY
jgi:hypothetical protein